MSDKNDGGQNDGGQRQAQQPDAPFYSGFEDAEVKQWVEAKGWKSPEALAKSALHLERMAGAPSDQLVRLPQDRSPESLRPVFERLGAPSDPQGYELPSGENSIPEYEKAVRETYHKLGLTKDQAKALTEFNLQFAEEYEKQANESRAASATVGEQELKREWGNAFPRQLQAADRAVKQLGFTDEMVNALQDSVGYRDSMKFLADLGAKLTEDSFVSGDSRPGFGGAMTPEQARQAWGTFSSDPVNREALMNRMHPRHAEVLQKKAELFEVMYPDG